MLVASYQSCDVCHIHHENRFVVVGNLCELCEINYSGISTSTSKHHFWLMLFGQSCYFIIINSAIVLLNTIRNDFVKLARKIQMHSMGKVPAMGQIHAKNGVTWLQAGKVNGHVGAGACMRLYICMFSTKKLASSAYCKRFGFINKLASAVISFTWIPFSIFVGKNRTLNGHDRRACVIFGGNHFQTFLLPGFFVLNCFPYFWVCFFDQVHSSLHLFKL